MARIKGQHETSVATTERQHAFLPGSGEGCGVYLDFHRVQLWRKQ